ncbi:MAG: hypothetical protein JF564_06720, partial [Sphingomonas sp.]|nr:hypothetical protein [Sphingomonas sp.]
MLPKTGTLLPRPGVTVTEQEYASRICQALRDDLGGSRAAAKSIMRWTGASNRTARNWLNGAASPSGYHLVCLARGSNAVLAAMLSMSGRPELALSADIRAIEVAL